MDYLAHTSEDGRIQTVKEHCVGVAFRAAEKAQTVGLYNVLLVLGLLHDIGKYSIAYQEYIRDDNGVRGSVNHTTAGAKYLNDYFDSLHMKFRYKIRIKEIFTSAILSHHGVVDFVDEKGVPRYLNKLNYAIPMDEILPHISWLSEYDFKKHFELAIREMQNVFSKLEILIKKGNSTKAATGREKRLKDKDAFEYYTALLYRLILSYLVDADWEDTSSFIDNKEYEKKDVWEIRGKYAKAVERKAADYLKAAEYLESNQKPIANARNEISLACRNMADDVNDVHLFVLPPPTGSAKTFASVRYGIHRSIHKERERLFYIAPHLSILSDNASKIKKVIRDNEHICELYSGADSDNGKNGEDITTKDELFSPDFNEYLCMTTTFRLIESSFSSNMKAVRRFHSFANSVLLIDEPQKIPFNWTTYMTMTLNFLAYMCNTDILLMTATMPPFEFIYSPMKYIENPEEYVKIFKKVRFHGELGCNSFNGLIKLFNKTFKKNAMVVLNTKKAVRAFRNAMEMTRPDIEVIELSKYMCDAEIQDLIQHIRKKLGEDTKIVVITTNLIEAGVDLSFRVVYRSAAGLDSIIQAAGRCNRNGEYIEGGDCYIFHLTDKKEENITPLKDVKDCQDEFLNMYRLFADCLDSLDAMRFFYKTLYNDKAKELLYLMGNRTLHYYITENDANIENGKYEGKIKGAYRYIGKTCSVFEERGMKTVYVPYKAGKQYIKEFLKAKKLSDKKKLFSKMQPYAVNLFESDYNFKTMLECGKIHPIDGFEDVYFADKDCYEVGRGFVMADDFCII